MRLGSARRRLVLAARLAVSWRPTGARLRGLLRSIVTSFLALGGMLWILPGLHSSGPASVLVLAAVVVGVGAVLRPVLVAVVTLFGALGLLLAGVLTQAIVLDVALSVAPGVNSGPFRDVLLASWLVAAIAAVVNWVFDVGSDDAFLGRVLGHSARVARLEPRSTAREPGVLIVQIDGLGQDVLRQAITAGAVPTISRWLRTGSHRLRGWHTGAPATTPAGQAVLLYGDTHQVPGFRWYEKPTGRLMVANRSRDAAEIERRLSDGRGLLADGGVSLANLFSGDAPVRLLTMSDPRLSVRERRQVGDYVASWSGLPRAVVLMLGEMITELQQGRRQRHRNVQPRVSRLSEFVVLRAVTTVLLRNLAVSLLADHLVAGAPVLYVDFVDYDEVAHHAGPSRPEAIRTLDGIDRVLRLLEQLTEAVHRDYELVVLSDHGQALGATFRQQCGRSLEEVVAELTEAGESAQPATGDGAADEHPVERWGPANLLLTGAARRVRGGRAARRLLRSRTTQDGAGASITLGPGRHDPARPPDRPVVASGGSLAHVYLPGIAGRATEEQIRQAHPRLLDGLRRHRQIGLVLVRAADGSLRALGCGGWREVTPAGATGGEGDDPLAPYGPAAARALAQLDTRAHVGDLVLLGRYDPEIGETTAFEELVGSHGGLGGGQENAVLITPSSWLVPGHPAEQLDGPGVHRLLLSRLIELGLRKGPGE
ncbi:MAG TPA: alkaline phosphatase family protein [Jatrophihabitans sp.]|nr:alkaline phosphatase family protein [Jatrophihabitans sp.]